jgi:NADPH-dependent ferric siderophore reductase
MANRDFPRRKGVATLVGRRSLTPRMIRVTLRCEGFGDDWPLEQPGEIITLLFAEPGHEVVLPVTGWSFPPGAEDQAWRNYTVRRHDPAAGEIDVDVVLHDPRGPACTWAADAPLSSPVGYAGPRVDFAPRFDARWLLLCGDETAVPAIAAILETPQPAPRLLAVLEVHDRDEELDLALPPGADATWVHRDGAWAATTSHLADALRALELPEGPGQAWGAAESMVAKDIRAVLRGERGMPMRHVKATGYWRRADRTERELRDAA